MSEAWLNAAAALPDLAIVGLVDLHKPAAQRRAEQFALHNAVVGDDLAHTLRQTSAEIVCDCTIPEAHLQVTLTALAHGCHVLGEKPLADSLAHAQQMLAAAQAAGKLYAVIQNRRYDPNIRRMRRLVASGELGQLTTLTSDFAIGAHFGGFRDQMRHVLLLDMAIHTFDAARLLSGADPVSVYCKEWNPSGSWYAHGAAAVAIFELSDGTIYTYRGSWCAEGLPTSWEGDWRLVGTRGSARWDGGTGFAAEVVASTAAFAPRQRRWSCRPSPPTTVWAATPASSPSSCAACAAARSPRRSAPIMLKASRWCSAPSPAPSRASPSRSTGRRGRPTPPAQTGS